MQNHHLPKTTFCHPEIGSSLPLRSCVRFLFLEAVEPLTFFGDHLLRILSEVSSFFLEIALFRLVEATKQPSRVTGMLGRAQRGHERNIKEFPPRSCTRICQLELWFG